MSPNSIDAARARIAAKRAQREKEGDSHFGPESNLMDLSSDEVDTIFDPLLNKATGLTESVTKDVNTLISQSNHESHHNHEGILPVNENEPLMQKYPFDRKTLVLGKTKLILMKNELGEGIKFITLTY